MKTIELSDEEYTLLMETLEDCDDSGPSGFGWKSDELDKLIAKLMSYE